MRKNIKLSVWLPNAVNPFEILSKIYKNTRGSNVDKNKM